MSGTNEDGIEILAVETLSDAKYKLRKIRFAHRRGDGERTVVEREVYELPPSAAVLPFDRKRRTVLLARQLRIPAVCNGDGPFLIEACAGHVEAGDSPSETARREAEEELGYRLGELTPFAALYMSPGLITEKLHLFLADYAPEMKIGAGGGLAAEGEDIRVLELGLDDAWRLVEEGAIADAKTVLLLQHLRLVEGG